MIPIRPNIEILFYLAIGIHSSFRTFRTTVGRAAFADTLIWRE